VCVFNRTRVDNHSTKSLTYSPAMKLRLDYSAIGLSADFPDVSGRSHELPSIAWRNPPKIRASRSLDSGLFGQYVTDATLRMNQGRVEPFVDLVSQ
jgi:hypothetical protein